MPSRTSAWTSGPKTSWTCLSGLLKLCKGLKVCFSPQATHNQVKCPFAGPKYLYLRLAPLSWSTSGDLSVSFPLLAASRTAERWRDRVNSRANWATTVELQCKYKQSRLILKMSATLELPGYTVDNLTPSNRFHGRQRWPFFLVPSNAPIKCWLTSESPPQGWKTTPLGAFGRVTAAEETAGE